MNYTQYIVGFVLGFAIGALIVAIFLSAGGIDGDSDLRPSPGGDVHGDGGAALTLYAGGERCFGTSASRS